MPQRPCGVCGEPMPQRSWWQRWFGFPPFMHDPRGPQADACWIAFNKRLGIENPGPRPDAEGL